MWAFVALTCGPVVKTTSRSHFSRKIVSNHVSMASHLPLLCATTWKSAINSKSATCRRGRKNRWSVLHLAVEHEKQLNTSLEDSRETKCKGSEPWKFTYAINAPEGTQLNPLRTFIVINSRFAVVVAHIM